MNSKSTVSWFLVAAALAAAIWLLNTRFHSGPAAPQPVLAGLNPATVTSIRVIPLGALEIQAEHTNHTWTLDKPIAYPAQSAAIDGLLGALAKLTPALAFSPGEMSGHTNAEAELGFENPQFTLDISAGARTWHLIVGNKTAPGDGVYVRVVGAPGALITDPEWLQFLPHNVDEWRDTSLVSVPDAADWLIITNGTQAVELRRDPTNHLWRMIRPLQTRANGLRLLTGLQQLRSAHVARFVTDDPKADLATYGLDAPALDLWIGTGTNLVAGVHVGKDVTGAAGEVFARREGLHAVVTTAKEPLNTWRGNVNDFRDPNLFDLTAPVTEIEVKGESNFALQEHGSNQWSVAGEKFPVDADQVKGFIKSLAGLAIADFAQDVVTPSGLQRYGLATPAWQITLRGPGGAGSPPIAQLMFGSVNTNEIYAKCGGEEFVYTVALDAFKRLPLNGDYFRDRQVWNFSETDVASVTLRQGARSLQMLHLGTNQWSVAAGSQGEITPPAVEEAVHRLGHLTVAGWIGRNFTPAEIGLTTNSLSVTLDLKSGRKYTVDFGAELRSQTALAAVTLDGERWAFVFPPVVYPLIRDYLTIPPAPQ